MSIIYIRDNKELLHIGFQDIKKYHGNLALMAVAVGFRSLQAGFQELFGSGAPDRKEISIVSGHGGPGFRDAFEFVTRAVTRGVYKVDVDYPAAQYDPHRPQSYAFVISTEDGKAVEVSLKDGFLPMEFYDYLKKGREKTMTEQDTEQFTKLKQELSERALLLSQDELLSVRRIS
jgi:formylmethanofuran dehydrogenase subunit E